MLHLRSAVTGEPLAELGELAERAARAAAEFVAGSRPERLEVAATKTSPTDVVTEMDRAAEQLIRSMIHEARADDAVLGEESGLHPGRQADGSGLTWVIDPIDGTVNYLYGLPWYAVSVAVVAGEVATPGRWRTLAGCVINPGSGECWTATAGAGAFLVGTGFGYRPDRRRAQAEVLRDLLPQVRDLRRAGSAALDLCAVASGRLDAFYERGLHPWDIAAGILMITEAGGRVVGPAGGPPSEQLLVAAREPLLGELAERLTDLGADRD
jgi:myo-inositol-1(or 4)-monophosphatase